MPQWVKQRLTYLLSQKDAKLQNEKSLTTNFVVVLPSEKAVKRDSPTFSHLSSAVVATLISNTECNYQV